MAEASYSNCPKVSLIRPSDVLASRSRSCRGSLLRASTRRNNIPGTPDVNGRKYYSSKTGKLYFAFLWNDIYSFIRSYVRSVVQSVSHLFIHSFI